MYKNPYFILIEIPGNIFPASYISSVYLCLSKFKLPSSKPIYFQIYNFDLCFIIFSHLNYSLSFNYPS